MKNKIVNLTPHNVVLIKKNGEKVVLESEGAIRVNTISREIGEIEGVKMIKKELTDIDEEQLEKVRKVICGGGYVIVSMIAAQALKRVKSVSPEHVLIVGNTIRNEEGKIIGADALTRASDI